MATNITNLKTKVVFTITTKSGNKEVRQLQIKGDYNYGDVLESYALSLINAIEAACTH